MCYTYTREQLKGKPVVRRGPPLRSKTFVWGLHRGLQSSTRKLLSEVEAKLQGPSYSGGQPVAANECVSFELSTETIHPKTRMDFILSHWRGGQNILNEHGETKDYLSAQRREITPPCGEPTRQRFDSPRNMKHSRDESVGDIKGKTMSVKYKNKNGFSLSELMIATLIFTFTFAGIILVFFRCIGLNEMARNSSTAVNAAKSRLASIGNTPFANILATFNNTTFTAAGVNGTGVTYVTSLDVDLLRITIVFCWQEKNGLVLGEDKNINGALNAGEDANGNGVLDSLVELTTYVYDTI